MGKFCSSCGSPLKEDARFCENCGASVQVIPQPTNTVNTANNAPQTASQNTFAAAETVSNGIPAPGFSQRVNDPEILAAVKKNKKAGRAFALFIVPLPLIICIIISFFNSEFKFIDALVYGGIISFIFFLFTFISSRQQRASNSYEGVVTGKNTQETYRRNGGDGERERITEYLTHVRTTAGQNKTIRERNGSQVWAYNYLNVGDRFRYHPQFAFPYELYDKSKAPYICCVSCGTHNPVEADRCKKCNVPLLK